jgi:SAM-dependent methyltransferase
MTQESYSDFYSKEYRALYVGKNQATESFFDQQYAHGIQIYSYMKPLLNKPIEDILVVEVGVGAGGILKAFSEAGAQVVGCDLGSDYLEYGRLVHGLDLRFGFFEDLQLDRNPDLVIYSHVLEHVLDPVAEMRKVACALGPGGLVYIEVPGVRSIPNVYSYDFLKYLQSAHTFHFTRQTLENLMEKSGYRSLQSDERVIAVFLANDDSLVPSSPWVADDVVGQIKKYEYLRPFFEVHQKIKLLLRRVRHKVYRFLGMKSTAEKKVLKRFV